MLECEEWGMVGGDGGDVRPTKRWSKRMITSDIAWEELEQSLLHGANKMWHRVLKYTPEDKIAEFIARMEEGELAILGEWSALELNKENMVNGEMLALPSYAFGCDGPGEPVAAFLVVHSTEPDAEPNDHEYIGIGWVHDAYALIKPPLVAIEGGQPAKTNGEGE